VNRAGKGMMLTAYDRPAATSKQLDMQETIAQLESALATAKALAASASSAKAEPADTDAQQQMKDDLDGLKKPGLLMSTPSSAGLVAGGGVQFAAQGDISAVAGKNADWSVMKRWTVAAGEMISLFARNGLKIFAAKGPVEFHAQSGPMSFIADKDVNLASVNGKVNLAAAKEITLECGGAFIHMKDGSITLGGPGDLFLKTITIQKKAKASMNTPMPSLPRGAPAVTDLEFRRIYPDGSPVAGCSYVAWINGRSQRGTLDAEGYMRLSGVPAGTDAKVRYLDDPNSHSSIHTVAADDDLNDVMQQATRGANA
jgi:type VI secretion system secreted protein VgrG